MDGEGLANQVMEARNASITAIRAADGALREVREHVDGERVELYAALAFGAACVAAYIGSRLALEEVLGVRR